MLSKTLISILWVVDIFVELEYQDHTSTHVL